MLYGVAFLHSTVQVSEEVCQSLILKLVDCLQMHNNVVGTVIFRSSAFCILVNYTFLIKIEAFSG